MPAPTLYELGSSLDTLAGLLDELDDAERNDRAEFENLPENKGKKFDPAPYDAEQRKIIAETIGDLSGQIAEKCDGIGRFYRNTVKLAQMRREEGERLIELAGESERRAERLKSFVMSFMKMQEAPKITTALFKFSICKNGGILPLKWNTNQPEVDLPGRFIFMRPEVNNKAIREALEAGETIAADLLSDDPFFTEEMENLVELGERGEHLRII